MKINEHLCDFNSLMEGIFPPSDMPECTVELISDLLRLYHTCPYKFDKMIKEIYPL